jgi:hypothetical protein
MENEIQKFKKYLNDNQIKITTLINNCNEKFDKTLVEAVKVSDKILARRNIRSEEIEKLPPIDRSSLITAANDLINYTEELMKIFGISKPNDDPNSVIQLPVPINNSRSQSEIKEMLGIVDILLELKPKIHRLERKSNELTNILELWKIDTKLSIKGNDEKYFDRLDEHYKNLVYIKGYIRNFGQYCNQEIKKLNSKR